MRLFVIHDKKKCILKDSYPKYVITLDEYSGTSYEGIRHIPRPLTAG